MAMTPHNQHHCDLLEELYNKKKRGGHGVAAVFEWIQQIRPDE
jgi:hypothetical protein